MLQSLGVTLFPFLFLCVLFGGGGAFRRRNIDQDGKPPINSVLFYTSKYLIMILWAAMILQNWGVRLSFFEVPFSVKVTSLCFWVLGFVLLFIGRFSMGESFRIGSPKENTHLKVRGLFSISRNPMYLGVYSTIMATVLYTLNPILCLVAIFIIAVHHKIVLAEEVYLQKEFGEEYQTYRGRVRRYL